MLIVGLTGGIGSGKTTVANMFSALGVPIYIADDASKQILANDLVVREKVIHLLGEQSYSTVNHMIKPDKKYIASKVFNDKGLLTSLNMILHPAVRLHFNNWLKMQAASYIIYEAAILLESGGNELCDYIVLVTAPVTMRKSRVILRDKITEYEVNSRIQNQWRDKERLLYSDFVIINEDIQKLAIQVDRIHQILLK